MYDHWLIFAHIHGLHPRSFTVSQMKNAAWKTSFFSWDGKILEAF